MYIGKVIQTKKTISLAWKVGLLANYLVELGMDFTVLLVMCIYFFESWDLAR
jgi:hypothetical protein